MRYSVRVEIEVDPETEEIQHEPMADRLAQVAAAAVHPYGEVLHAATVTRRT